MPKPSQPVVGGDETQYYRGVVYDKFSTTTMLLFNEPFPDRTETRRGRALSLGGAPSQSEGATAVPRAAAPKLAASRELDRVAARGSATARAISAAEVFRKVDRAHRQLAKAIVDLELEVPSVKVATPAKKAAELAHARAVSCALDVLELKANLVALTRLVERARRAATVADAEWHFLPPSQFQAVTMDRYDVLDAVLQHQQLLGEGTSGSATPATSVSQESKDSLVQRTVRFFELLGAMALEAMTEVPPPPPPPSSSTNGVSNGKEPAALAAGGCTNEAASMSMSATAGQATIQRASAALAHPLPSVAAAASAAADRAELRSLASLLRTHFSGSLGSASNSLVMSDVNSTAEASLQPSFAAFLSELVALVLGDGTAGSSSSSPLSALSDSNRPPSSEAGGRPSSNPSFTGHPLGVSVSPGADVSGPVPDERSTIASDALSLQVERHSSSHVVGSPGASPLTILSTASIPAAPTTGSLHYHEGLSREDVSRLVRQFYQAQNPAKVDEVDNIVLAYDGRVPQLFAALNHKYLGIVPQTLSAAAETKTTAEGNQGHFPGGEDTSLPTHVEPLVYRDGLTLREAVDDVEAFYRQVAPGKVADAPAVVHRHREQLRRMYDLLNAKYLMAPISTPAEAIVDTAAGDGAATVPGNEAKTDGGRLTLAEEGFDGGLEKERQTLREGREEPPNDGAGATPREESGGGGCIVM